MAVLWLGRDTVLVRRCLRFFISAYPLTRPPWRGHRTPHGGRAPAVAGPPAATCRRTHLHPRRVVDDLTHLWEDTHHLYSALAKLPTPCVKLNSAAVTCREVAR